MSSDLHPEDGPVVFRDPSAGTMLLARSALVGRLPADHPLFT